MLKSVNLTKMVFIETAFPRGGIKRAASDVAALEPTVCFYSIKNSLQSYLIDHLFNSILVLNRRRRRKRRINQENQKVAVIHWEQE